MDPYDGPDSAGMFKYDELSAGWVPPDYLRLLWIRLLDPDPNKRPTAEEAAEVLREIRD